MKRTSRFLHEGPRANALVRPASPSAAMTASSKRVRREPSQPRSSHRPASWLTALVCSIAGVTWGEARAQKAALLGDPTKAEVRLDAAESWRAHLLYAGKVGIWTVRSFQVQPWFACPEVVALDDSGMCTILRSYSGKWTPTHTVHDQQWLGPVVHGDVDPRHKGQELYTGGKSGRVFQVVPRRDGGFDTRCIASFVGEEVHTLIASNLRVERRGHELIAFTRSGRLFELLPNADPSAEPGAESTGFVSRELARVAGRVRDAVVVPGQRMMAPWVVTVSRAGEIAMLRLSGDIDVERRRIAKEPMGLGRVALASTRPLTLFATRDDGVILRFEEKGEGFAREIVYAGPQGPRGLVVGRFYKEKRESIAVFGYSKKVQIVSRRPNANKWDVETIFTDIDKGHWLEVAELDGRNSTDEILGSGYGGRVFMLSRPPGYGLRVAVDPGEHKVEPPRNGSIK